MEFKYTEKINLSKEEVLLLKKFSEQGWIEFRRNYSSFDSFVADLMRYEDETILKQRIGEFNSDYIHTSALFEYNLIEDDYEAWNTTYTISEKGKEFLKQNPEIVMMEAVRIQFEDKEWTEQELSQEIFLRGWDRGKSFAESGKALDAPYDEIFEAEENDRQYSPFEFFASSINSLEDQDEGLTEAIWEKFNKGITAAVQHVWGLESHE